MEGLVRLVGKEELSVPCSPARGLCPLEKTTQRGVPLPGSREDSFLSAPGTICRYSTRRANVQNTENLSASSMPVAGGEFDTQIGTRHDRGALRSNTEADTAADNHSSWN